MARETILGLGLAALGRPGYINLGHDADLGADKSVAALRGHAESMLDAAWSAGIRYFDAARSYGRAEEFLAGWLSRRKIDPAGCTVASKWGYTYTANWRIDAEHHEIKDHSQPVLERQWQESRDWLGPWIRRYQIHSATRESGVLENAAVLDALARLRDSGLGIGLSVSGPRQAEVIRSAVEIERDGRPLFESVQATWNLLERSAAPALAEARARGLTVIVKEALANGRLTARGLETLPPSLRSELESLGTSTGHAVDVLGLAAALHQPWAGVVLSGAGTVAHLRSHVLALTCTTDATDAVRAEAPEEYWTRRAKLRWN